jgi:hypothetical protein
MAISLEYLAAIYITAKYQYFTGLGRKKFQSKDRFSGRPRGLPWQKITVCADELVIEGGARPTVGKVRAGGYAPSPHSSATFL